MFCYKCGREIEDDSNFCCYCGHNIKIERIKKDKVDEDLTVKYYIKPVFDKRIKLYTILLHFFIAAFWVTYIGGVAIAYFYPSSIKYVVVILIVYFIIIMYEKKKQYKNLEYRFYRTRMEYKDGISGKIKRDIKYSSIKRVSIYQNPLEKILNIGKIRIEINKINDYYYPYNRKRDRNYNRNQDQKGIMIPCGQNFEEYYRIVEQIISLEKLL